MISALLGIFKFIFIVLPLLAVILVVAGIGLDPMLAFVTAVFSCFAILIPIVIILGILNFIGV